MSRSGANNPSSAALVASIRALGVEALVLRADVAFKTQVKAAMRHIDPKFPVRGVVNAAVVLQVIAITSTSAGVYHLIFHRAGWVFSEHEH